MSPRTTYRTLALAETVTWTLLLAGMFLKYAVGATDVLVRVGGGLHGFVFLAYCLATVLVGVDGRWSLRRTTAGLASAFVPFLTLPFERYAERSGGLAGRWRLRAEPAASVLERVVGAALRAPVAAAAAAVVVLAVVFSGLLAAGPPTTWGQ